MQTKLITSCAISLLALASTPSLHAQSFWDAVVDTTPAGLVDRDATGSHQWSDLLEGTKKIFNEGRSLWIVPTYTEHPSWSWDNRRQQNAFPFGMGLGRQIIDDRGNERTLFFVTFVDSNYRIEPALGYQWVARYPLGNSGLHVGAGYMLGATARGDYGWYPLPMPLPVVKFGADWASLYLTYIPATDVYFAYTVFALNDQKSRHAPLPAASPWSHQQNYLYAGYGWEYMDSGSTEDTVTYADKDWAWHVGLRHYSGRHWATDFSYRRSQHLLRTPEARNVYRFEMYALQLQYNLDVTNDLRLYAGGGFGYSMMRGQGLKDDSIHPVTSLGATYAITDNLFVDANMTVSFSRFKDSVKDTPDQYFKAMPTDFNVSLGYAF